MKAWCRAGEGSAGDNGLGLGTVLARAGRPPGEAADGGLLETQHGGPTEAAPGGPRVAAPTEPLPLADPITLASVYRFEDLSQVDEVWEGRAPGHVYRRFGHPNAAALERLLATLEGAESALACASGMGAIVVALAAHLQAGDTVVAQRGLYGGTQTLLTGQLERFGIRTVFAAEPDEAGFAPALAATRAAGGRPRALLAETIANPSLTVADLPGLAGLAQREGLLLVIDNTFATPLGCRPLGLGPALVVHSATKYLNGHTDVIGGVVAGPEALVGPARRSAIALGLGMAPLDAWLTVRGLRTLHLRFARQVENAARIAAWLEEQPGVKRVLYPGLPSHPSFALANRVLESPGAMISFELAGGEPAVDLFVRGLRLIAFAPSLGETETTVMYPARTSHRNLSPEEKLAAGAGPGLVRLSAGTEDVEDLLRDLGRALEAAAGPRPGRG